MILKRESEKEGEFERIYGGIREIKVENGEFYEELEVFGKDLSR